MPYKTNTYFMLLDALDQPGCAICRIAAAALQQYINDLFSEHLWVMERRQEMRVARGFCPAHAPLIDDFGRALGMAVLHQDLCEHILRDVDAASASIARRGTVSAIARAIEPAQDCIFCRYSREQEHFAVRTLMSEWRDEKMHAAFVTSAGLCLPHFHLALGLREIPEDDLLDLIELERAMLNNLASDLTEFIRKSNLAYATEPPGREADSPRRALGLISGRVTAIDSRRGR